MIAIGITDIDWFMMMRGMNYIGEINFWTPTPWSFRALQPGELFYFLVKAPIRKVGGYGAFVRYEEMRASEAWYQYGLGNGVSDLGALIQRVHKYADRRSVFGRDRADPEIGCIILDAPVFLDNDQMQSAEELGAPVPNEVVKFKTFRTRSSLDLPAGRHVDTKPFTLVAPEQRAKRQAIIADRVGQQAFRAQVLQAYGARCAVSGETCLEVLEAAHIQPYVNRESNDVRNGIALRADLHVLFDAGLITVDIGYRLAVSSLLVSPTYRTFDGGSVLVPRDRDHAPSPEALEYHRTLVFRDVASGLLSGGGRRDFQISNATAESGVVRMLKATSGSP
jgi:putative restriction endonuclease